MNLPDTESHRQALKDEFIMNHYTREPDAATRAMWNKICIFEHLVEVNPDATGGGYSCGDEHGHGHIFRYRWSTQPELPPASKDPLLWHLEECVIAMDRVCCETGIVRIILDLRDTSAKNVWSFVNMGVIKDLTDTIDRCFVIPMKSVHVLIPSFVIRKVWSAMNKLLLPEYCRQVCSVVNSEDELSIFNVKRG